ncbi:MAG: metallophosphoesterase [Xanthobacteraceae bacterium]|nr:MAG: metallophosphoesterase [Xanthobacteraceae bacterium]
MTAFTLAHLSDPHLSPLPEPSWSELAGKRITGYLNWRRGRAAFHRRAILEALVADLRAQQPDHVAVTGDLANIALAAEFAPARTWLETLGTARDVTVVPGNHDVYVDATREAFARAWTPYLIGDQSAPSEAVAFPFVRRRGPLALIGLSSALPTPPFMATGKLGAAQLARLTDILARLAQEPVFRVVLVHHPLRASAWHKRLVDSEELSAALARHGAELVLHGHDHRDSTLWLDGTGRAIPVIGVPSASAAGDASHDAAAYNLYRIARVRGDWVCEIVARGWHEGAMTELRRIRLF